MIATAKGLFVRRAKRVQLSRRGISLSRTVHSNYNNYIRNNNNNHINKGFPRSDFEERKKKRCWEREGGIVWEKKKKERKKVRSILTHMRKRGGFFFLLLSYLVSFTGIVETLRDRTRQRTMRPTKNRSGSAW